MLNVVSIALLSLMLLGVDVMLFFLVVRVLAKGCPATLLCTFDQVGDPLLRYVFAHFDQLVHCKRPHFREGTRLALCFLGLTILRLILSSVVSSIVM